MEGLIKEFEALERAKMQKKHNTPLKVLGVTLKNPPRHIWDEGEIGEYSALLDRNLITWTCAVCGTKKQALMHTRLEFTV